MSASVRWTTRAVCRNHASHRTAARARATAEAVRGEFFRDANRRGSCEGVWKGLPAWARARCLTHAVLDAEAKGERHAAPDAGNELRAAPLALLP